jgi:hypothetical protein
MRAKSRYLKIISQAVVPCNLEGKIQQIGSAGWRTALKLGFCDSTTALLIQ